MAVSEKVSCSRVKELEKFKFLVDNMQCVFGLIHNFGNKNGAGYLKLFPCISNSQPVVACRASRHATFRKGCRRIL